MSRLHELLRLRAQALATPPGVIERALARCARSTRMSGQLGSVGAGSGTRATTPIETLVLDEPPPPAPPVADPAASAPGSAAVTVPSLNQAPPAPPPREGLAAGRIIAGYRIEGLLGKGGMGSVYRATQLSMNRLVAFKVLSTRLGADPAFVNRFKREARAAGRLHHPNLITVHDWGEADGHIFFSMELVEGRSFKDIQKERGRLPADEVLRAARQVLEALRYAHGKGVVHRDIKPDNIMLDPHGHVKVADLGLSLVQIEEAHDTTDLFQTEAGSFMGTPHYMPPEQGRDAHAADARSDLYSLGATCFHLLVGRTPFEGTTPMAVLVAAQTQPLAWGTDPPAKPVQAFIERLMAKEPERRPQDAAAALAELDRLVAPAQAQAAAPRRGRWRWWLAGTAAGAVLTVGVLAIAIELRRKRAFEHLLAQAQAAAQAYRFPEALDQLRRLRTGAEDDAPRAKRLDGLLAQTAAGWDAWSLAELRDLPEQIRNQIAARRFEEANAQLRAIPAAQRSPAAEELLDQLGTELLLAAARQQQPPGTAAPRPLAADLLQRATFSPPDRVARGEGRCVFTGRGTGRLPLAGTPEELHRMVLHVDWGGAPAADAAWEMSLGSDLSIETLGGKAWVKTPEGRRPLLAQGEGGLFRPLRVRDDGIDIALGPLMKWQPRFREIACTWSLPAGSSIALSLSESVLDGRRRFGLR